MRRDYMRRDRPTRRSISTTSTTPLAISTPDAAATRTSSVDFHHAPHADRQHVGAGIGQEQGDGHVVDRGDERQKRAGGDARGDQRQGYRGGRS